jgi:hypothetical protein
VFMDLEGDKMRYNTVAGKIYLSNGCYSVCFLANYGGSAVFIWCVTYGKANGRVWLDMGSLVRSSLGFSSFSPVCSLRLI